MKQITLILASLLLFVTASEAQWGVKASDVYTADTVLSGSAIYFTYPGMVNENDRYITWVMNYKSDTTVAGLVATPQLSNDGVSYSNFGTAVTANDSQGTINVTATTEYGIYYRLMIDTDSSSVDTLSITSGILIIK